MSNGAIVSGADVRMSVISPAVRLNKGATLDQAIIMDNAIVGAGATLHRCIVDKNAVIPDGKQIGVDPVADAERFTVSDQGVTVVPKNYRWTD